MAHDAENEAKQLDSVTDRHQEKDFDESKAKEAMSALSSAADSKAGESDGSAVVKVSKEDVAVIVKELEVTEDEAKAALRAAAAEVGEGQSPVAAALRSLVVS